MKRGRPFPRGRSGNAGGRPLGLGHAIRGRFGESATELIDRLDALSRGIAFGSRGRRLLVPPRVRLAAIVELLNRGYGRPVEAIEVTGADGGPVDVLVAAAKVSLAEKLARLATRQAAIPS